MEHALSDTPSPSSTSETPAKPVKLSTSDLHELGLSRSQVQSCIRRADGVRVTYLKPGPIDEALHYNGPQIIATKRYEEKRKSRADVAERMRSCRKTNQNS